MSAYPVQGSGGLPPNLARDVGRVLEQYGLPRVNGLTRQELEREIEAMLGRFIYMSRGPAGEIERRVNAGIGAPLSSIADEGGLDSYDCLAVAHELRRRKGASGALVIATDADEHLSIGLAADEGSLMDVLGNEIMESLEVVLKKRGWPAPTVKDVDVDFTVDEKGGAS